VERWEWAMGFKRELEEVCMPELIEKRKLVMELEAKNREMAVGGEFNDSLY
jgi:hypothetical protein